MIVVFDLAIFNFEDPVLLILYTCTGNRHGKAIKISNQIQQEPTNLLEWIHC